MRLWLQELMHGLRVRQLLRLTLPTLVVLLCSAVALWNPLPLQILRHALFDQYQRWQPRVVRDSPVRVIDIDDESLRRLGQWPWPRTRLAELATRLQSGAPRVVTLDVLLAEPDRTSPQAMLQLWPANAALRQQLQALPDHDAVLAQALGRGPFVLGMALERQAQAGVPAQVKARFAARGAAAQPYLHAFSGAINPLPELSAAARGIGAMTFLPDADGVVRRVPLLLRVGDALVPSLATETLRLAQGSATLVTRTAAAHDAGLQDLQVGSITLPSTAQGEAWLHYAMPDSRRTLPAWKVLQGQFDPSVLTGKLVLVGTSASGLLDLRFSPLGVALPGVEIHAQFLEQVLSGAQLVQPAWGAAAQLLLAALGGLTVGAVALGFGALYSFSFLLLVLAAIGTLAWLGFSRYGLLLDAVWPCITVTLSYVFSSLARHRMSEARQRWIRQAFSRYVSPNLVAYLIKRPESLELGGKRQTCSFVFTDLADSTALLETMDPAAAVSLFNDYLDGMIAIVFAHQGTLTRIVGDGLAILFSAPLVQPDHQQKALSCAWALHQFSSQYAARMQARGLRFGLTRVGVHSGEVMVGNFGGSAIFDYRALGDPINTAARLESANKPFGTTVCVSQATLDGCNGWRTRPVGWVLLQGKTQALQVHEVLGPQAPADTDYLNAFALLQSGQAEASAAFAALAQQRPRDGLVALHLARLRSGQTGDRVQLKDK